MHLPGHIKKLLEDTQSLTFDTRIRAISNYFLGCSYKLHPLGDGNDRFNFKEFDCVTYIEHVLALATTNSEAYFLQQLDNIRYRDGDVGYFARNHFFSADWIPNNKRFFQTPDIDNTKRLGKVIDKGKFFRDQCQIPHSPKTNYPLTIKAALEYVPIRYYALIDKYVHHHPAKMNLVVFVADETNLIVKHAGFLLLAGNQLILRHASSIEGIVTDEDLSTYIAQKERRYIGLALFSIREPAKR